MADATDGRAGQTRSRVIGIYGLLLIMNAGAWVWAWSTFRNVPILLGTAFLAYTLGLRHAVDADHIAAIDNVTRRMMQEGKRPIWVGFMFSMGHSTVVFLGAAAMAIATSSLTTRMEAFREVGGIVGTLVSALFLFGIGTANIVVLRSIYGVFQRVRRGEPYREEDIDLILAGPGVLTRIVRPVLGMVRRSWQMYPLGFLFGLGFDTATEIGVLTISANESSKGLSLASILVFPALFTSAMSLVDTTDNILMLGAYGWALVKPVRKLYYNFTITLLSVIMAFGIGSIEALGLLAERFQLKGAFWSVVGELSENLGVLGYGIIGLFVAVWVLSIAVYKWQRLDELECGSPGD